MKKIYLFSLLAAISLNLLCQTHWTKHPDNPVMMAGEEGEWDAGGLRATSIIYHDGIYHMWYTGGGLVPGETFIGYATSQDGFNWTRHDDNPVLVTGPAGSWDESLVVMPCVLIRDSVYHMWYTGQSGLDMNTNYKIGYATSPDGINWTKDMVNNPVLDKGPYGSFDGDWVGSGPVIFDGTDLRMWYGGVGGGTVDIGHATSLNGVSWTRDPDPVLTPGGWESATDAIRDR